MAPPEENDAPLRAEPALADARAFIAAASPDDPGAGLLLQLVRVLDGRCRWEQTGSAVWQTDCGTLVPETPEADTRGVRFCGYCGRLLHRRRLRPPQVLHVG